MVHFVPWCSKIEFEVTEVSRLSAQFVIKNIGCHKFKHKIDWSQSWTQILNPRCPMKLHEFLDKNCADSTLESNMIATKIWFLQKREKQKLYTKRWNISIIVLFNVKSWGCWKDVKLDFLLSFFIIIIINMIYRDFNRRKIIGYQLVHTSIYMIGWCLCSDI